MENVYKIRRENFMDDNTKTWFSWKDKSIKQRDSIEFKHLNNFRNLSEMVALI